MVTLDEYLNAGRTTTGSTGTTTGSTGTTTGSTGTTTATYNPDPYDWNRLLAYYKSPTDISSMYQLQDRPATPQYGYEYTQLRANSGNPVAPRYNVADPTNPTSPTAAQILAEYNTRKGKTETTLTQAILNDYVSNYNTKNAEDTTAAAVQGNILNEFNASRTNQQSAYNKGVADYNTLAADVNANPQEYYKPVQMYETPVVQNAYYNKFAPKPAGTTSTTNSTGSTGATTVGNEQPSFDPFTIGKNGERILKPELTPSPDVATTNLARGGYIQGYANGGMVQPQMPMRQPVVQDLLQQYNTPRQPIGPLGSLRGRQ
ncbi:MAG: hypothetical protein ACR2IJ_09305 [Fluviibacter sp.]